MSKNSFTKIEKTLPSQGSKFVKICFHILFFLTPLLLWPFTSEVFEFNKMIFVYLMTIIITSGWLIESFRNKKLEFVRTPLDLPLLLFFLSQLASTILSINPHTSFWGYYSRFHGGLASTICYITLFYAFVSNFKNDVKGISNIIKTILATATLTALYAIAEHFGIDKSIWVQDVQNRVFSTLGQPNWLSAYLIALLPLPLYFSFHSKNKTQYLYLITSVLFLISIFFTKSNSGIGATVVILFLFLVFLLKKVNKQKYLLLFIPLSLAIFFIPLTKNYALRTLNSLNKINPLYSNTVAILKEENKTRIGGTDSMAIRRVVWEGAIKLGLQHPLFGTGLETFGYTYYNVRPVSHNYTSETDFLYNKAHNEYLNFFANAGFIGLGTYLFLIHSIIKILTKNSDLSIPLLLGFISILITNYFGFSVVNIALFFFLFPALIIAKETKDVKQINLNLDPILPILLIVIIALFGLNKVKNLWLSDIYFGRGKSTLSANEVAIKLNPSEPIYVSQLGLIQSLIVTQIIYPQMGAMATAEASLKLKAEGYLNQYTADAIKNAQKAVDMNPYNVNLYKNKARTELTMGTIYPTYNNSAVNTLLKIIELSPTDPANYYNLGVLYNTLNNKEEAIRAFSKVLELYPYQQGAKDQLELLKK